MSHLLIWENAYAQIIRDGAGRVFALYPLLPNKMDVQRDVKADIQNNYLNILHNSLYTRTADKDFLGNWNLLLGNIPELLSDYEIDIEWEKLYTIFTEFLDISLLRL